MDSTPDSLFCTCSVPYIVSCCVDYDITPTDTLSIQAVDVVYSHGRTLSLSRNYSTLPFTPASCNVSLEDSALEMMWKEKSTSPTSSLIPLEPASGVPRFYQARGYRQRRRMPT